MSFRIGVDGGGTKTECILIDDQGAVVARHTAPGCNPSVAGPERARAILLDALRALLAAASRSRIPDVSSLEKQGRPPAEAPGAGFAVVDRVLLCMAGSQSFWRETAASLEDCGRVVATPDSLPVLELATNGKPGLVVHAGTGSFIAAHAPDGSVHYAGGLGWRFGDPASGYDLGRRAIALALLELQGWASRTALADCLWAYTGLADYPGNSRLFYGSEDAAAKIAGFAPRVVELAGQGCAPAQQVVAESINGLSPLVKAVCERLFPGATSKDPVPCGVSGAILNQPPCAFALSSLALAHSWPVHLRPVSGSPIEGVRRLLQNMA
jgi:glucosamine kinase